MKTTIAKKDEQKQWYVVDATDQVLGRLAVKIANVLRGRHKPIYTPNIDCGDHVVVINADKIRVTGKKEDKKEYLDEFWKGYGDYRGLKADVTEVNRNVRISEAKTLHLSNLDYAFEHDGEKYTYSIKNGKYGPYIEVRKEDGSIEYASIDQSLYFPGTFTDKDAEKILFSKNREASYIDGTDIEIRTSRTGSYLYRESDKKGVSLPRSMKADELSAEDALFIMSLPKVLGEDENGPAELRLGPYGYYVAYNGRNKGVKNPKEVTFESFKAESEAGEKKAEKVTIKAFQDLDGKPLEILNGKYGAYIKWGERNIALPKEDKENPERIDEERAKEIALSAPEKKASFRRRKK